LTKGLDQKTQMVLAYKNWYNTSTSYFTIVQIIEHGYSKYFFSKFEAKFFAF